MSTSILRYKADYYTFAFILLNIILSLCGFFLFDELYESSFWTILVPLCIATSVLSFSVAVIVHNTVHSPIFHKKSHNKIMQYFLSLVHGYSVSAFVPGHNFSHHRETQKPKDAIRTSKARFKWHFLNQFLFFFLVSGSMLKGELKWAAKMKKEKPAWFNQWLTETILVNILRIGVLFINLPAGLMFIWFPQFYAIWGLAGCNVWQHDGCDISHKYNHSRTFTGKIMNFFCFNNGYHGAHHDRPSLHWSLLPAYHEKYVEPYIHPNLSLDNMPLYLWKTHIYPGKRQNYDGSPFILEDIVPDEDWTVDINISNKSLKHGYGAESISPAELLQITEVKDYDINEEYNKVV
jgi:beta-carotene hydroxylase